MKPASFAQKLICSALLILLSACSSDTPKPAEPGLAASAASAASVKQPEPLPAHLRELSGTLGNVPAAADVEVALLAVDLRGRPQTLLGESRLRGSGEPLPFSLRFDPAAFSQHQKVELHARVNHSGRLILRLPAQPISLPNSQMLGELTLVPAP